MIYQQTHDRTLAQIRETYEDDRLKCSEKMKKIFKCICRSESLGFFRATMFPPIELKSETLPIFFDFENDVKKMLSATILEAQPEWGAARLSGGKHHRHVFLCTGRADGKKPVLYGHRIPAEGGDGLVDVLGKHCRRQSEWGRRKPSLFAIQNRI